MAKEESYEECMDSDSPPKVNVTQINSETVERFGRNEHQKERRRLAQRIRRRTMSAEERQKMLERRRQNRRQETEQQKERRRERDRIRRQRQKEKTETLSIEHSEGSNPETLNNSLSIKRLRLTELRRLARTITKQSSSDLSSKNFNDSSLQAEGPQPDEVQFQRMQYLVGLEVADNSEVVQPELVQAL